MGKMDVEIRGFMPNAWVISAFLRCASSCKLLVWLVSPDGLARKSDFSVQPLCLCVSVVVFTNNSLTTEGQRHRKEV